MTLKPGALPSRIGPYDILSALGAGGMGMVYRARHATTGQEVALKTVLTSRTTQLTGLRREIHALMQIRHPGIVRFVAEGVHEGRPWYAMELLDGTTLSSLMRPSRKAAAPDDSTGSGAHEDATTSSSSTPAPQSSMPGQQTELVRAALPAAADLEPLATSMDEPTMTGRASAGRARSGAPMPANWARTLELLAIIESLCQPLSFIHAKGIVHRDLKPSNILIRPDGHPVLMDFGLASRFAGSVGRESVDLEGEMRGTPSYMAPELLRGGAAIDARADLYSVGCILYEIATGQRLFAGDDVDACVQSHLHRQPLPPSELATVPKPLEDLILRLLAKDPRDRIGHADDIAEAIAAVRGAPPAEAGRTAGGYLYRPRLVGRERLSLQLEDYVRAAWRGQGRVVMIGGESGVGKTSLATAVTRVAFDQGFLVVTGSCEPSVMRDGTVGAAPLHPLRPLLQTIADHCVERGAGATRRVLGNRALVLAAYEPRLAELPGVDRSASPGDLPPEGALDRLFTMLAETISSLTAEQPVLLILDDLHWADDLTLRFLRQLPAGYFDSRRLLILGTYRSDEVSPALREVLDRPGFATMPVGRLSDAAINSLVADMLALPAAPPALLEFLVRYSDGNPFFVAEYLRAAVAEGLLFREAGRWRIAPGDSHGRVELPSSLRELVSRRLDGLDPAARRVVDAAATLGREFDTELLHDVADLDEDETFRTVGDLLERHVLTPVDEGRLAFAHHQIRDLAYERIESERRKTLHRAAAASIEARHHADADFPLRFVALARHWEGAGAIPKAVEYLDKAGDYALRTSAYQDTVRLLGKAAELASGVARDPLRDAHRQLSIAEAWIGLDDYANSRLHLSRTVSILGFPLPESKRLLPGLIVELGRQIGHRLSGGQKTPALSRPHDEATRAYALMQIAWRYTENPGLVLVYTALRGLNLAERGASPETSAMAFSQAVVYAATVPLHAAARRYEQMTERALAATTDRNAHSFAPIAIAVYHAGIGDWDRAAAAAARSAVVSLEVGFRRRREDAMSIGGFVEITRWRPDEATRIYTELLESARRGTHRHRIWALGALAVIALRTGNHRAAEARMRELEALHPAELDPADTLQLDASFGVMGSHINDPRSRKALDRALAALEKAPPVLIEFVDPCARLGEGYVQLWRKQAAYGASETAELARSLDRVCAFSRKLGKRFPVVTPDTHFWRAEGDWLLDRHAAAIRGWQASLAAAERCGMLYHQWRSHQALAEHHADAGTAEHHRQKADAMAATVLHPGR
jgi:hypothetical protein